LVCVTVSLTVSLLVRLPSLERSRDYAGDGWVGLSHESHESGVVQHSLAWIAGAAREHGLDARLTAHPIVNDQYWLRVSRAV